MHIYEIVNTINNKRYIGQTTQLPQRRWIYHKKRLNNGTHTNPHLLRAWKKYGESAFNFRILETCNSLDELNCREIEYISKNLTGYNLRSGGDNGGAHAEETKKKIRLAQLGKPCPQRGVGNNARGHKKSVQQIMSSIRSKVPNGYKQVVDSNGNLYSFTNLKAFCREHGLVQNGLRQVMLGNYAHHRGWRLASPVTIGVPFEKFKISLISPTGDTYTVENLNQFCRDHHLSAGNISEMIRGKRKSHKGWTLYSTSSNGD
jgi:group I intron endonuclease